MARALIIDETFIKENSTLDENIDMKLINPTIWYCQKEYIEPALGTALYNDICAEIISDADLSGVTDYLTLVDDYIADALLYWVLHESQVPLTYKFRNKSVSKNTDPNSQPVDFEQHKYLRDYYKNKAVMFTQRLKDYLCENEELFPLYGTENGVDEIYPKDIAPQVAVYLGGKLPKRDKYGYYTNE